MLTYVEQVLGYLYKYLKKKKNYFIVYNSLTFYFNH